MEHLPSAPQSSLPASDGLLAVQRMLSANDTCGLIQSGWLEKLTPPESVALLGMPAPEPGLSLAQNLVNAPERLSAPAAEDDVRKFYSALYLGGILSPKKMLHPNSQKAFGLLSELVGDYPGNGAFPFFRAAIRQKLHQSIDAISDDVVMASDAPDFDSQTTIAARGIYEWGLRDTSHYIAAMRIISVLPLPDYLPSEKLVNHLVDQSDNDFASAVLQLGEKLMARNEAASSRREFVFWNALEYQVGRAIAQHAWRKLHPGVALPSDLTKSYKDFLGNDRYRKPWSEAFNKQGLCDPAKLDDVLEAETRDFENWKPE
jgi:hypothetical protein